ncbi:MAG: hypothetical protein QW788_02300, partial [Candidatus Hadarchaeales archaeon]
MPNLREEKGVSEALGAAMVLSILLAAFSTWYPTYVRSSVYDSEAKHMEEVRDAFLKLQSGISMLEKGQSMLVNLRMQGEKPRFVPAPGKVGRILVRGGPRSGVGSLFTESLGSQPCPESLKGEGGGWYELSPLVFLEKFWSLENWEMLLEVDDPNTPSPEWTPLKSATMDGSGSIHVSAFCTDPRSESRESCWWVRTLNTPVGEKAQKITIGGKLMFVTDRGEGSIRVEVEDNGKWKMVYTRSWNQNTNGWVRFENFYQIENSITRMRLYLQVSTSTFLYDRRADLWMDEVYLILGPPYRVEA